MRKHLLTAAGYLALASACPTSSWGQAKGPSSSQTPYVTPVKTGVKITSLLTTPDIIGGYKMCGTPDGLGAFDNGDGTFTVLMNHEFGNTAGVVRAHGSKGAFVSKWIINKSDLSVVSGSDLIKTVKLWNGSSYTTYNAASPMAAGFSRFCSADLPAVSAFYNAATGKGTTERIFMNGEENGNEGRGMAHIVTGPNGGTTYELPYLGKFSMENLVANPATGDKTIVAGMDDATPGQVYFYIGTKTTTGTEIEKAGLSNGNLYAPAVSGLLIETSAGVPAAGTPFTMVNLGDVHNTGGTALNTASNNAGVTQFLRPEDGAWDPLHPEDFYFATTNAFGSPSRLWKMHFTNINDLTQGGTITAVLDGTEGQQMLDNITIDHWGHILLVEDVGGNNAIKFARNQPADYSAFDHFTFLKEYINPLFLLNQQLIKQYHVVSKSLIDYSLNKKEINIFNKSLYNGQNSKGIFLRVTDADALASIDHLGKLLFYDPILSGNNLRSCASCHKPTEFFTDTLSATALQFNRHDLLPRNTPTLVNAPFNHLIMLDGKHISLQNQTKDVITNPKELACTEQEVMEKVLSCNEYKSGFKALLKYTPQEKEISFEHIVSAITSYYARFSNFYSPFDEAMNNNKPLSAAAIKGFNLFMSKAQCATCHFVPQFNGVKPPYIGSEFEVVGVPKDTAFKHLSNDKGRFEVNPASETLHAFRTGTIRNAARTAPYMHNGIFTSLNEIIEFYNNGGGAGRKLFIENQTLSADPLQLTGEEKHNLLQFIQSLNEDVVIETTPQQLPVSKIKALNTRKPGGEY